MSAVPEDHLFLVEVVDLLAEGFGLYIAEIVLFLEDVYE
jgi:hypothetical protein